MLLDITDLLHENCKEKLLDLTFKESNFSYADEEIIFSEPVNIKGKLKVSKGIICLDAKVKSELLLTCSRCLEKFKYPIDLEINEKISDKVAEGDDDTIIAKDSNIDLDKIIQDNIILALPVKKLCKKDCKGLCPNCGANLNYTKCNCKIDNIDPRFAKLKDLFS